MADDEVGVWASVFEDRDEPGAGLIGWSVPAIHCQKPLGREEAAVVGGTTGELGGKCGLAHSAFTDEECVWVFTAVQGASEGIEEMVEQRVAVEG